MKRSFALLVALVAIAAACHRETKNDTAQATATTAPVARGGHFSDSPDTPPPASQPAPAAEQNGGVDVGSAMPAYTAKLLDGSEFDLAKEKGNVVFLNLWATWCGPCRYEIPELEKMHKQHAKDGFKVVGVSLDEGGVDPVKEFVAQHSMTYPVALDPDGQLANIFHTSVIPTSVVIDRGGKVVWKKFGAVEAGDKSLADAVAKALATK